MKTMTRKLLKRITFLFSLLIMASMMSGVQAQPEDPDPVEWAIPIECTGWDYEHALALDQNGNPIFTGYFDAPTITLGGNIYSKKGSDTDIFIAKYDPLGNVIWVSQAGASSYMRAFDIDTDNDGNIFVTGYYRGTVTFYSSDPGGDTRGLTSTNTTKDVFVAKYDPDGNILWLRGVNANYDDEGHSVAADSYGNCFLTGAITGQLERFGGPLYAIFGTSTPISIPFYNSYEKFVAKYDADGEIIWVKKIAGYGWNDYRTYSDADNFNNCLVTGVFDGETDFGSGVILGTSSSSDQFFLAKYNGSDGSTEWVKTVGGDDPDETIGYNIATDNAGNSVVIGNYSWDTDFGEGGAAVTLTWEHNLFLAKYSGNGDLIWAKEFGGSYGSHGYGVTFDNPGNVLATGSFIGTGIFGFGEVEPVLLESNGFAYDIFVAKYDPSGNIIWARKDGGASHDEGFDVKVNDSGNSYISGVFQDEAVFGEGDVDIVLTQYGGQYDYFLMKLEGSCQPAEITEIVLPAEPVAVTNQPLSITVNFTDSDFAEGDEYACTFDFGDGTAAEESTCDELTCTSPGHSYSEPGVYTVTVTVSGDCGEPVAMISTEYIVIYDPSTGFVTGGGWIDSPEGAYIPDPGLTGKANFGFVSKYKKGQTVPDGNTEFQFRAADMNFHSSNYEWLVIAGAKAMFKGIGTINGYGNYGFLLSSIDADLTPSTDFDLFRIKIWDKDNLDAVVYDNNVGIEDNADPSTAISGGSIKIHTGKKSGELEADQGLLDNIFSIYPNPFSDIIWFELQPATDSRAVLDICDLTGRKLARLTNKDVKAGQLYRMDYQPGADVANGILFYKLIIDGEVMTGKIIHRR